MWPLLSEFDESDPYELISFGDWSPMIRVLRTLKGKPYALTLRAFTSVDAFIITPAEEYPDHKQHDGVVVRYHPPKCLFAIGYACWGPRGKETSELVAERDAVERIDALVERLLIADGDKANS